MFSLFDGSLFRRLPRSDYCSKTLKFVSKLSVESPLTASTFETGYAAEPMYDGIPFPSGVRDGMPWTSAHRRPLLVSGCFNAHGSYTITRRRMRAQCVRDTERCRFLPASKGAQTREYALAAVYAMYWNSTFCLHPPGDAISRKGVIDSLLLGCIPVFVHPDQARQWPWHFAPWAPRATVTLSVEAAGATGLAGAATNIVDELARIPAMRVHSMQRTIAENAWRLAYRTSEQAAGGYDDAFAIVLRQLTRRRARAMHLREPKRRDCGAVLSS